MNDRIAELAEQAGVKHYSYDIYKFAKLIIKECSQLASDYDGAPLSVEETILDILELKNDYRL